MRSIDPAEISQPEAHRYLLAGVAPRPIALVGTVDGEGRPNLSPFSFFNAFGSNPPVIAFSPALRGSDASPKHTFLNVLATGEFTVSVVSFDMVEQISLASGDFAAGVNEYRMAGLTPLPSAKIAPAGVAESPMVMECRLLQQVPVGDGPGSANILIGEVVMFHIKESAFDGTYMNADRLDLVARMGGPLYCRASGDAVFRVAKPTHPGIGFEALPEHLLRSPVLTGNDLAKLAGVAELPPLEPAAAWWGERMGVNEEGPDDIGIELRAGDPERLVALATALVKEDGLDDRVVAILHHAIAAWLRRGEVESAWRCARAIEAIDQTA